MSLSRLTSASVLALVFVAVAPSSARASATEQDSATPSAREGARSVASLFVESALTVDHHRPVPHHRPKPPPPHPKPVPPGS